MFYGIQRNLKDIFHSLRTMLNVYVKIPLKKSRRKPKPGLGKYLTKNMGHIKVNIFIYFAIRTNRCTYGFGFVGKTTDKTLKIWVYH